MTPNPFSHVLTPAKHQVGSVEAEGCFWLKTGPAGFLLGGPYVSAAGQCLGLQ